MAAKCRGRSKQGLKGLANQTRPILMDLAAQRAISESFRTAVSRGAIEPNHVAVGSLEGCEEEGDLNQKPYID